MLFDLRSPRRRAMIRVVYAFLALLIGGGLIAGTFGTGGGGGLLDSLFGNGSTQTADFSSQITAAQKRVQLDPKDPRARLNLVRIYVTAGIGQGNTNASTGQRTPTADSIENFGNAADAWQDYLKLNPKKIDPEVAALVVQADIGLAETSTTADEAENNVKAAAEAQKIVAAASPSQGSLGTLAQYQYFAGETAAADQTAKQALAKTQSSLRATLKQSLTQIKANAVKFQSQIKAAAKAAKQQASSGAKPGSPGGPNPFANPLQQSGGGLGGGSSLSSP